MGDTNGASLIEIGDQEEVEDPFLAFLDYARTVISPEDDEDEKEESKRGPGEAMTEASGPGWGWVASRILKTCTAYSSGVTAAILLSDLSQAWHEQNKPGMSKKKPELIDQLKKGHRRRRLANTVTIDSIYEKNFLSMNSVLEAVIINADVLPGILQILAAHSFPLPYDAKLVVIHLKHKFYFRYYELVETPNGILRKGREVLITGCYLRTAREGFGTPRLLPTEYLVVLLDEDQDDDAILIAAQFCSDTFSSVSLDAFNDGASYSLYARIESIGPLESELTFSTARRRQISLVDGDGDRLKFILWGEQVIVANLLRFIFSVGSVLGIERPYISSLEESAMEGNYEFCLEYGSATHLYLVPSTLQEERVCVALSQHQCQGSKLLGSVGVSQVTLPRDADGSVDFSNYPFRLHLLIFLSLVEVLQTMITDIRDKTTGISLYGVVTDISCDPNATGVVVGKVRAWSCRVRVWVILQNHKRELICRVKLDEIDQCHNINTRLAHSLCGHFIDEESSSSYGANLHCSFCRVSCNSNTEVVRTFHITITLADEETKLYAWCTGQSASAILQISPDEFCDLPENEWFLVILANSGSRNLGSGHETDDTCWEITRALKI
ncbi:unnamed protein product [Arabidopsis thaliana]|uniref:Nucleic acid-binding proteins superfamily n=1 Tax=Arabidopsis thaliana TaxID=3702 RepID=Q9LSP4_ARATH|nr:unnamed protein product [Arabidopsis thaliana]